MRALLRSLAAPVVPPIDLMLRDLTALGELDEHLDAPTPPPLPSSAAAGNAPPPLPLQAAPEHEWALPAFDDARLLNLNKKRREADVLCCVRRCQRGEYVFAPQRRDRPLPLARTRAV